MKKLTALILMVLLMLSLLAACNTETPDESSVVPNESSTVIPNESSEIPNESSDITDESSQPDENSQPDDSSQADDNSQSDDNKTPNIDEAFAKVTEESDGKSYFIETAEQLKAFADIVNNEYHNFENETVYLISDIDLSDIVWEPIGNSTYPFKGEFIGANEDESRGIVTYNRVISGITYSREDMQYAALFGVVENAKIACLEIADITIDESCGYEFLSVAGVVHTAYDSSVITCTNSADISAYEVAGVVFHSSDTQLIDCKNYGNLTAVSGASGVVDRAYGEVLYCINYGNVKGAGAGGVIGGNDVYGTLFVKACTNYGEIVGRSKAGGILCNILASGSNAWITDCLNAGSIECTHGALPEAGLDTDGAGGIVGSAVTLSLDGIGDFVMKNVLNVGAVTSNHNGGGIVANGSRFDNDSSNFVSCYTLEGIAPESPVGVDVKVSDAVSLKTFYGFDSVYWNIDEELGYPVPNQYDEIN